MGAGIFERKENKMDVREAVAKRRSVRTYRDQPVSQETVNALLGGSSGAVRK